MKTLLGETVIEVQPKESRFQLTACIFPALSGASRKAPVSRLTKYRTFAGALETSGAPFICIV
jgi:hypothetical protein